MHLVLIVAYDTVKHMEILYDCCSEHFIKQGIGCALKKNYTRNVRAKRRLMISMDEHLSGTVPRANV
jgi:hypothetical protein